MNIMYLHRASLYAQVCRSHNFLSPSRQITFGAVGRHVSAVEHPDPLEVPWALSAGGSKVLGERMRTCVVTLLPGWRTESCPYGAGSKVEHCHQGVLVPSQGGCASSLFKGP